MVWTTPVEELVGEFLTLKNWEDTAMYRLFQLYGKQLLTAPWNCYVCCFFLVCLSWQKFQNLHQQTQLLQEATLIFLKLAAILAWVHERSDSLPVILGWWNTAIVFLRLLNSQFLCFFASLVLNGPITATSSGSSWWMQWCGKVHITVPFFVPSSATPSVLLLLLLSRRTSMASPWPQGVFLLMCSSTFKNRRPIIQPPVGQFVIQRLPSGASFITALCILTQGKTPTSRRTLYTWVRASWIEFNNCPTRCDLLSLLYFCRQLYMFWVQTPIFRSSYNCNYSLWYWLTGSATIRSRC